VTDIDSVVEVADVANISVNYVESFAASYKSQFLEAAGNPTGDINVVATAAIETTYSFAGTVTTAQATSAIAAAVEVPDAKVTLNSSSARRLSKARRLASFGVMIAVASTEKAKLVSVKAENTTLLSEKFADLNVQVGDVACTMQPKLKMDVKLTITIEEGGKLVEPLSPSQLATMGDALGGSVTVTKFETFSEPAVVSTASKALSTCRFVLALAMVAWFNKIFS